MKTAKMLVIVILVLFFMVCQAKVEGAIGGSGTANRIPKFTGPTAIGDSAIFEDGDSVSIGTTKPEKGYRLTVDGAGSLYGIYVRNTGDVGIECIGSNYGLRGSGNSRGVSGVSTNGFGVFGQSTKGFAGYFKGGRSYFEGNVGIGTTSPDAKLTVEGIIKASDMVYGETDGAKGHGVHGVATYDGSMWPLDDVRCGGYFEGMGLSYGIYAKGSRGVCATGGSYGGHFVADSGTGRGVYAKGGPKGYAAEFHGNVIIKNRDGDTKIMELGEGLDYAEGFDVSDNADIQPGSVLIIDSDNPGKLSISNEAYDSKVAGIVAGAKGQGSGVRLGADEFDYDVALAGRVYCNVDATELAVQPGDLLTTSATEGYAMKATDYMRAQGAILGKAMEKLEKGKKGQILVLVTLQ